MKRLLLSTAVALAIIPAPAQAAIGHRAAAHRFRAAVVALTHDHTVTASCRRRPRSYSCRAHNASRWIQAGGWVGLHGRVHITWMIG
jgi:hypothetical protein